jgi:hypothetical protein
MDMLLTIEHSKVAFTLDVKDPNIKSPTTKLII